MQKEKEHFRVISHFSELFLKKHKLNTPPKNIDEIITCFSILNEDIKKGEPEATIMGDFIFKTITDKRISTKVSANNFEMLLAEFFDGRKVEKEDRKNIKIAVKISTIEDINRRVTRNLLEKLDVQIGKINISAKTLIPKNKELNIGSFSAEALFNGFINKIPNERDTLGSKPLLKKVFIQIQNEGKWEEFKKRFLDMIKNIYTTDLFIAIKNDKILDLYIINKSDFQKYFCGLVNSSIDNIISFINRFEAHALRTEREPLLKIAKHISINLEGKSTARLHNLQSQVDEIYSLTINSFCNKDSIKTNTKKIKDICDLLIKSIQEK